MGPNCSDNAGLGPVKRGLGPALCARTELLSTPKHSAHEIIRTQKRWLQQKFQQLLEESGHQQSQQMATALLTLHEGATVLRSVSDFPAAISDARTSAEQLLP